MARKKKDEPTWSAVKSVFIGLDHKTMVELAEDLYRLSKENRDFFRTRFGVGQDQLAPYKKTIEECMYPNVYRDKPIQISKAKNAISSYTKAVADPVGEAELMTFFVECGNSFTVEYGDIDEDFYNALTLMYRRTIEKVLSLAEGQHGVFRRSVSERSWNPQAVSAGVITMNCVTTSTRLSPSMNDLTRTGLRGKAVPTHFFLARSQYQLFQNLAISSTMGADLGTSPSPNLES